MKDVFFFHFSFLFDEIQYDILHFIAIHKLK